MANAGATYQRATVPLHGRGRRPKQLVFVSAKTTSRAVAPWLAV
jgi:hypothetical protein